MDAMTDSSFSREIQSLVDFGGGIAVRLSVNVRTNINQPFSSSAIHLSQSCRDSSCQFIHIGINLYLTSWAPNSPQWVRHIHVGADSQSLQKTHSERSLMEIASLHLRDAGTVSRYCLVELLRELDLTIHLSSLFALLCLILVSPSQMYPTRLRSYPTWVSF